MQYSGTWIQQGTVHIRTSCKSVSSDPVLKSQQHHDHRTVVSQHGPSSVGHLQENMILTLKEKKNR